MRVPSSLLAGVAFGVEPLTRWTLGNEKIEEDKKGQLRYKKRVYLDFNDPRDIEVRTEPYKNGSRLAIIKRKIEKLDGFGNKIFSEDKEIFSPPNGVDFSSK